LGELPAATRLNNNAVEKPIVLVADLEAITQPLPGALASRTLKAGENLSIEALKKTLGEELGYHHEAVCEGPGQFALRGGIVDVYPPNAEAPVRLDFFGDRLESIKTFDPTTQRSEGTVKEAVLSSAKTDGSWKSGGLMSYLPAAVQWIMLEPTELESAHAEHFTIPEKVKVAPGHFVNFVSRENDTWLGLQRIGTESGFFAGAATAEVKTETPAKYRPIPAAGLVGQERTQAEKEMLEMFVKKTAAWEAQAFAFSRGELAQEFQKILKPLKAKLIHGAIAEGFILHGETPRIEIHGYSPSVPPSGTNWGMGLKII